MGIFLSAGLAGTELRALLLDPHDRDRMRICRAYFSFLIGEIRTCG